jgi:hypothetical protein
MLSKNVCKRCLGNRAPIWNPTDEDNWKNGFVDCRSVYLISSRRKPRNVTLIDRNSKITEPPPDWCSYRFQHAVARGMKCTRPS